jgi:hypothetical protein
MSDLDARAPSYVEFRSTNYLLFLHIGNWLYELKIWEIVVMLMIYGKRHESSSRSTSVMKGNRGRKETTSFFTFESHVNSQLGYSHAAVKCSARNRSLRSGNRHGVSTIPKSFLSQVGNLGMSKFSKPTYGFPACARTFWKYIKPSPVFPHVGKRISKCLQRVHYVLRARLFQGLKFCICLISRSYRKREEALAVD